MRIFRCFNNPVYTLVKAGKKANMTKALLIPCLVALAMVSCVDASVQTAWYVAVNGSDSNNGSIGSPLATVNKAISVASAGDTVYLREGVYRQAVRVGKPGTGASPITISGYPNEVAIIDGNHTLPSTEWGTLFLVEGDHVIVRDLTVANSNWIGLSIHADHCQVLRVEVRGCMEQGLMVYQAEDALIDSCLVTGNAARDYGGPGWACALCLVHGARNSTVQNCTVWENRGEGISSWSGSMGESYGNTIQDNISHDNWANNIYVSNTWDCVYQRNLVYNGPGTSSQGIEVGDEYSTMNNHDNVIINNVVHGCTQNFKWWSGPSSSDGMRGFLIAHNTFMNATEVAIEVQGGGGSHDGCRFENNIIYQPSGDIADFEAGFNGIRFSHNIWSQDAGTGDVVANPMINSDGTLKAGSPAINAGLSSEVLDDHAGALRDTMPDTGAYEYDGGIPPATETPAPVPTRVPTQFPTGVQPAYTPRPTYTLLPTYTPRPTYTPLPTYTPRPTLTSTPSKTSTFTIVPSPTLFPTATLYPTYTPYPTATWYPTQAPYPTEVPY